MNKNLRFKLIKKFDSNRAGNQTAFWNLFEKIYKTFKKIQRSFIVCKNLTLRKNQKSFIFFVRQKFEIYISDFF